MSIQTIFIFTDVGGIVKDIILMLVFDFRLP